VPDPPYTPRIIDAGDVPAGWLSLEAAIVAYGKSERTLRRLLTAGELEAVKVQGPYGLQWRIAPPSPDAPRAATGAPTTDQAIIQAGQMIQAFQRERDELRDELAAERAARLADKEEMGRLRGRLEAAEAELERARQLSPTTPPEAPRRRWWQR
jgi:hypothetical protein